ncbi:MULTISPECIES: hypothetical protein [Methanobacterium]|jgi:hypothetical protein|uniref:Uncharacterized protein n=1 Tax=Methanobacterium subterraneum TaxID=59277 RepID=A0A2H4VRA8_9EURY|nr:MULTISPECIES: hypothetical protein [Methanobacterium]AUB57479.1 hypothetical protein BK008_03545 [Methanobacterium sp. MZ-A1]AUB60602.1 hypothetical protein BK009_07895 [Methanobacterium subterraneum]MBW4258395.1 hypothetical protein [Methanobacterium sp. YSL]NMO09769.1 hypothetical protein [Methanobacterium subterraneum]
MAYLMRTSSSFLGENIDFERESYLEGFIFGNPLVLAVSQDSPEGLVPVYIIGRQDMLRLKLRSGITDLTCLIWDPNINKYEIWIFELKVYSNSTDNVKQLTSYIDAVEKDINNEYRADLIQRAKNMVGEKFINPKAKIRGALCAQSFSDEVLHDILEENSNRNEEEKIVAVKIFRFPADNENFIFVERIVGEEKSTTGGPRNYYADIPHWELPKLEKELYKLLKNRKINNPGRFEQLKVFLQFFVDDPSCRVSQQELREKWEEKGLPGKDQGMSVSQFLGYKNSGSLRQMLTWTFTAYMDIKEDYRLRDSKYSEIISKILNKL